MNALEGEHHFVLVSPFYSTIRDKYIKPYYYNTPSMFKLTQLLSIDSSKHLIKLCKYLTTATMHRSDNIVTRLLLKTNIFNIINITHLLLTFVETIIFTISRNVHIVLCIYVLYLCMPTKCIFLGQIKHYIYLRYDNGNVLFNDALNTFYLRLYGVRHMVKDHSDSEKGNPLPPHRLLFPINSKGSFICTIPQTGYHIPRPLLHQSWSIGWNEK